MGGLWGCLGLVVGLGMLSLLALSMNRNDRQVRETRLWKWWWK